MLEALIHYGPLFCINFVCLCNNTKELGNSMDDFVSPYCKHRLAFYAPADADKDVMFQTKVNKRLGNMTNCFMYSDKIGMHLLEPFGK